MPQSLAIRERLERGVLILSLLDALRKQSGIPHLGRSLEHMLLGRELLNLEISTAFAELDEQTAAAVRDRCIR